MIKCERRVWRWWWFGNLTVASSKEATENFVKQDAVDWLVVWHSFFCLWWAWMINYNSPSCFQNHSTFNSSSMKNESLSERRPSSPLVLSSGPIYFRTRSTIFHLSQIVWSYVCWTLYDLINEFVNTCHKKTRNEDFGIVYHEMGISYNRWKGWTVAVLLTHVW